MLIKKIEQLRGKLEKALVAKEVDKAEVLKLSMELDKYIAEYMKNGMTDRKADKNNSNL